MKVQDLTPQEILQIGTDPQPHGLGLHPEALADVATATIEGESLDQSDNDFKEFIGKNKHGQVVVRGIIPA